MDFSSLAGLRAAAFIGFERVQDLVAGHFASLPTQPGVYLLIRDSEDPPAFLTQSPAGWFKGKDPTLPISSLEAAWIPTARVVYIGKAGGAGLKASLRSRIAAYLRHGSGARAAHWGGRAVWQLPDSGDLLVAWRTLEESPREAERRLIEDFVATYGKRPFANRAN